MVRDGYGTKWQWYEMLWYEMAMVRNGYGTKMIFIIMLHVGTVKKYVFKTGKKTSKKKYTCILCYCVLSYILSLNHLLWHGSIFIPDFPGFRYE
jgi:hypothetical protein